MKRLHPNGRSEIESDPCRLTVIVSKNKNKEIELFKLRQKEIAENFIAFYYSAAHQCHYRLRFYRFKHHKFCSVQHDFPSFAYSMQLPCIVTDISAGFHFSGSPGKFHFLYDLSYFLLCAVLLVLSTRAINTKGYDCSYWCYSFIRSRCWHQPPLPGGSNILKRKTSTWKNLLHISPSPFNIIQPPPSSLVFHFKLFVSL